ncbi:TVP38/TMEM64 family protein [Desulfovibrio sp. JC010]|uniref:TVP38/TMEM64 family protein n=1 Tax=Desulfovibrio sp. JC010 TaxID=2593641 RepID=UPI0013D249BA|nr:VTT domain-containing protein [Desulfovibrio sp. JC010]NDV26934.1 TVP38/TMEM64 family protein [Desulfovibrio sp. JC010]
MHPEKSHSKKLILHGAIVLLAVGALSLAVEHWGEGHLSALAAWIEASGNFAPVLFMAINVVGMVLVIPQTLFTVVAGVLFGALKGTAMCLISMAVGASLSFFLGRFVLRGRVFKKFRNDPNFMKMEMLSRKHPVKVLALSRIVPVVPYSVANYLWAATGVRFLPYLVMSVLCLIPETVFLTAGGHLLSAGVREGTMNWEMLAVLAAAAAVIFFLVRAVRRSIEQDEEPS